MVEWHWNKNENINLIKLNWNTCTQMNQSYLNKTIQLIKSCCHWGVNNECLLKCDFINWYVLL